MGAVCYQRPGCPDMDVRTSRFEGHNIRLVPLGRREAVHRLQRRLRGAYKSYGQSEDFSGAARRTISHYNIQQNTARIARTAMNVVICR
jgi:hypothetical protein